MNQDQAMSAVRTVIGLASGYAIGKGYIDSEQATLIAGLVFAVVPFIWGWVSHTRQAKIAAVAAMPNVATIVTTDQKTADAAPSPKVVSVIDAVATARAGV